MINVSTWHKHALRPYGNGVTTHGARRWFQIIPIFLAVLSFNLNDGQFSYSIFIRSLLFSSCLCFLFTYSADHFEKVFFSAATSRCKILIKIRHEHIRREPLEDGVHPEELITAEYLSERSH